MRLQNIVLAYFLIGATMWGGGVLAYEDTGMTGFFIEQGNGTVQGNENTSASVSEAGGPIQEAAQGVTGGIVAVWNLLVGLVGFLFWPISTLVSVSAPSEVVVLLGGAPTVAFYGAIFRVFRQSA